MPVTFPKLIIDLAKIRKNTRAAVAAAGDIEVFGVTKGCAGSIPVAQAMLDGGVAGLADSRLSHLTGLRQKFPATPLMSLRQPMRHEVDDFIALDLIALVSDLNATALLAQAAARSGRRQPVVLMMEVGDGREGIPPSAFLPWVETLTKWPSLDLRGIAANVGCHGGRAPSRQSLAVMDRLAADARARGIGLEIISAGNSSCWRLLKAGLLPAGATQVRIGEAILLGRQPMTGKPIAGLRHDAFTVQAEALEFYLKDNGPRLILAIGRQDIGAGEVYPVDARLNIVRMTSDHGVVAAPDDYRAGGGDIIDLRPSYFALQSLSASAYVRKTYVGYNNVVPAQAGTLD